MIGVLQRDYVRTALAKGLPVRRSLVGMRSECCDPGGDPHRLQVAALPGGSLFVELIFNIPGLGSYGVDVFRATCRRCLDSSW